MANLNSDSDSPPLTPMMKQYLGIKADYPDAILFYRLGDFYEMFFEDALTASRILDITLTTRNKNSSNPVPLCGVPWHSADAYIAKLTLAGKKVAICEQTEDPKQVKGIVKREVTRVITPGTLTEEQCLSARSNNHLLCFFKHENGLACAVCDVSTGKLEYFDLDDENQLLDEICRLEIREILSAESTARAMNLEVLLKKYPSIYHHTISDLSFDLNYATDILTSHYGVQNLSALGLDNNPNAVRVTGGLLDGLKQAKILSFGLLRQPVPLDLADTMLLDETTVNHLELFHTQHERKRHGTLLWHLDNCQTPMGARLLADWIRHPLKNPDQIQKRLDAVENLLKDSTLCQNIVGALTGMPDLERIAGRFVTGSAGARDAMALANAQERVQKLSPLISENPDHTLVTLSRSLNAIPELKARIFSLITDEPPATIREGGFIRRGVNIELDDLRDVETSGKGFILKLESQEKKQTGIPSLKVRYNNVFGYYIEITHTHRDRVPEHYIRKQTLTNAERYITEELKNFEDKVLGAAERIRAMEYGIFQELKLEIANHAAILRQTAGAVAMLDVLTGFSGLAKEFHCVKPAITDTPTLDLKGARHPILERLFPTERFVPNDLTLGPDSGHMMIITGPNMAGKSTLMRTVALITLMAQVGAFVPCEAATIGVCDRIFTRVGAHDHLQKGLSTFMVEMIETACILREATPQSLILLDEIGRGTSTFDGLSIAWAVAEDLHDRLRSRTLFATHYHELCDLQQSKTGIRNHHMAVREWNGEILFLRKLKSGGTNRSYGVTVGGMAGLPAPVVSRAREVLKLLEMKDLSFQNEINASGTEHQLSLFDKKESAILRALEKIDVNAITPMEALGMLAEWKEMASHDPLPHPSRQHHVQASGPART